MSIDSVVFKTFRKLGVDDSDAVAFADELNHAIDRRYQLHALYQHAVLVTNNTREFAKVPGLRLENWA